MKIQTLIAVAALTSSATAAPIINGSFETPSTPDGTLSGTAATPWTGGAFQMNPNASGNIAGNGGPWPQAQDGEQYRDIGNSAHPPLTQVISVTDSLPFEFSWWDNTFITSLIRISSYRTQLIDASLQTVFSVDYDAHHSPDWIRRSETANLSPGTYTLSFTPLGTSTLDVLLDNVSATPVPEPSSIILLFSCAVCCTRPYRRRSNNEQNG